MNLPHLKIPKVEEDAEDTFVAPPPEVPISATVSPISLRDKARISYVYSSRKKQDPCGAAKSLDTAG